MPSHSAHVVVPVRFVAEGQAVQCTTRELSVSAALLSCPEPPKAGSTLSVRLFLPGERVPLDLVAVVRAPVGVTAFWVDFAPGGDEAKKHIAAMLARLAGEAAQPAPEPHPAPRAVPSTYPTPIHSARVPHAIATPAGVPRLSVPPSQRPTPTAHAYDPLGAFAPKSGGPERRVDRRVHGAPLPVRFATVEEFVLEYAANISAGGVFIKTDKPPPLESRVRVRLELPDGGPPLEADGVVLHRLEPVQAGPMRSAGAGVQFVSPSAEFKARIERFLDDVLAKGGVA